MALTTILLAALQLLGRAHADRVRVPTPATPLPAAAATGNPLDREDVGTIFGVNTHNLAISEQELDLIQKAGIQWIRDDVSWALIEPRRGQYDYSSVRAHFQRSVRWIGRQRAFLCVCCVPL